MTLRGPADADRFRVQYRGARYYIDPLPGCEILPEPPKDDKGKPERLPSFTAIKSLHSKVFKKKTDYGTHELTAVRAARYVAANKEHLLQLDEGGILAAVASAPQLDLSAAGERGNQIHLLMEAKVKGHVLDKKWVEIYAPKALPYVDVIEDWWADQFISAEYAEVVGLNWEHRYAFTSDVLGVTLRAFPGQLIATDWKTRGPDSNHGAYHEEGQQAAAAAFSEYIFVDRGDGTIVRRRPPPCDLGLIVSIKPDSVEMYEVDLDLAWQAWTRSCAGWRLRQEAASLGNKAVSNQPVFVQPAMISEEGEPVVIETPASPPPSPSSDAFAGLPDENGLPQVDRAAKAEHLRDRVLALTDTGKALLAQLWPAGVYHFGAARRQATDDGRPSEWWSFYSVDGLRQAEAAIESAEDRTEAPFPMGDEDDGEPSIDGQSEMVKALWRRHDDLPEQRRPRTPGFVGGNAKVKDIERWAGEIGEAEKDLAEAVAAYRAENAPIDPESVPKDILAAGRAAAKLLGLPAPRKASDVKESTWIWRAMS